MAWIQPGHRLLTARATWAQGTEAAGGDIDGNKTTRKFLLHSLEGTVHYLGSAGVTLRTTWRGLRAATLCSTGARALALRVHSSGPQIVNGRPTGAHEVKYSLPGASEVRTAVLHRPALVVEHGGQTLGLALHAPHPENHP